MLSIIVDVDELIDLLVYFFLQPLFFFFLLGATICVAAGYDVRIYTLLRFHFIMAALFIKILFYNLYRISEYGSNRQIIS